MTIPLAKIEKITLYLSKGAILHPILRSQYLDALHELYCKGKVTPLPETILELYHHHLSKKKVKPSVASTDVFDVN